MQRRSLRKLLEPSEPGKTIARLPHNECNREHQIHCQRKDLCAQNRPADALYRFVAPAQLRPPPQHAGRTQLRSVNAEYSTAGHLLRDGDEVGLLPPVSGGGTSRPAKILDECKDEPTVVALT